MQILTKTNLISECCDAWRAEGRRVILVPTMGYFHAGHISLMHKARELAGDEGRVVVSLFVNPTQFGVNEDLSSYPRNHERDAALAEEARVDAIFMPEVADMYSQDDATVVAVPALASNLCGVTRPTHFQGVCTIVLKLFMVTRAHIALFGQKDWQQQAIIKRMVADLRIPIEIIACPIVREADGLALSSRNVYLSPEERAQAPEIYKGLCFAQKMVEQGEHNARIIQQAVLTKWAGVLPLGRLDYLSVIDATTLVACDVVQKQTLMACAVQMGKARLIDNILLSQ